MLSSFYIYGIDFETKSVAISGAMTTLVFYNTVPVLFKGKIGGFFYKSMLLVLGPGSGRAESPRLGNGLDRRRPPRTRRTAAAVVTAAATAVAVTAAAAAEVLRTSASGTGRVSGVFGEALQILVFFSGK